MPLNKNSEIEQNEINKVLIKYNFSVDILDM